MMVDENCGDRRTLVWDTYCYDYQEHLMDCSIVVESLDADGGVVTRSLPFSWIEPEEVPHLAAETGLAVESVYGDFEGGDFGAASSEQVWVLRRAEDGCSPCAHCRIT